MDLPKYSSYRLFITRRIAGLAGYFAVAELAMYDGLDGQGSNLLTGGVATASSGYGPGFEPSMAFDGNFSTRWSSASSNGPEWLRYDLPEPVGVRSFRLRLDNNPANGPSDFIVQGSNDGGVTWTDLASFEDFATSEQISGEGGAFANLSTYGLEGVALLDNGARADTVIVCDWVTGQLVSKVFVEADGSWRVPIQYAASLYLVIVQGPAGTRPQAHGPVYPEVYQ